MRHISKKKNLNYAVKPALEKKIEQKDIYVKFDKDDRMVVSW